MCMVEWVFGLGKEVELYYFKIIVVILIKFFCLNLWVKWIIDYIIIKKVILDGNV